MPPYVVCALYKFTSLPNYRLLQQPLLELLQKHEIKGTLLLASEGINGTVAGTRPAMDQLLIWFEQHESLSGMDYKESEATELPFYRTKVRLKKEIVTLGVDGIDPLQSVGTYVEPQDWNTLISDPDVTLIDTRNDYEVEIGSFQQAIDPKTKTFREFPAYVKQHLDPKKHRKVAMFCTGGIRCEKSTAYLKQQGFEEVYHLKGGILKYLEEIPEENSLWKGDCFVFDNRVSLNHALESGNYDQCHACRMPITEADKTHAHYRPGVSCPKCYAQTTAERQEQLAERERQMQWAQQRGETHIGGDVHTLIEQRRREKKRQREQAKSASSKN